MATMTQQQIIDMFIRHSNYVAPREVGKTFTQLDYIWDSFDREIFRCNNVIRIINEMEHPNILRDIRRGRFYKCLYSIN